MKSPKKITLQLLAGANVATALLMLLIGLSDRVSPVSHPTIACAGLVFPAFLLANLAFLVFFLIFKWRYAAVSVLGFLVCYPSVRVYCPLNVGTDLPDGSLKVLSYNVCSFDSVKNPTGGIDNILSYICETNADIVCLQEARIDDRIKSLAKDTYAYMDSVCNDTKSNTLVLLSKYPIVSKERIKYESKGNLSAAFKVKIYSDTVTVINNHFETSGLSPEDRTGFLNMMKGNTKTNEMKKESRTLLSKLGKSAQKRAPQAETVAEYAKKCRQCVILCGDFNDNPISYTRHTLANVLTDCYVATANGPGFSYHHNAMRVRIDNIMCSTDYEPYGCKVDGNVEYSDHYPIYCWLKK